MIGDLGAEGESDEEASETEYSGLALAEAGGEDSGDDQLERRRVREAMAVAAELSG